MQTDARDITMSGATANSAELYEKALTQFQCYVGDPIETIDSALAEAPDFAMGHLLRAAVLTTLAERSVIPEIDASLEAVAALSGRTTERERGLAAGLDRCAKGDWDAAQMAMDHVLTEFPRDALTIQTAHLMDFYRGDALNLRNRISRVRPHWSPSVPGYSYILGMHAFGLEECSQYREAEETARQALDIEPRDGWAVHAGAHVMEMQGRTEDGIYWMETRQQDWAPDNGLAFHNWWHLALYYLEQQRYDGMFEIFDREIHPEPAEYALQLVDVTAMLWRLHLLGIDTGDRFQKAADDWEKKIDEEAGFYAFNDYHALMAFLGAGRHERAEQVFEAMNGVIREGSGRNVMMTREVGLPLCDGVKAFAEGRYDDAIQAIEPVRDGANRFGGSHAQRDIITLTLIESALRAGRDKVAEHYIAERTVHKPSGGLGWRLRARCGSGRSDGAETTRNAA